MPSTRNRDAALMQRALRLAQRAYGDTSPNPLVGALLARRDKVLGRGWHRMAGSPHAEIEALQDAARRGHSARGATLYVTLEPCCTHGRTPPCTDAIIAAGIKRVVVAATDPNPRHAGRGFEVLRRAKIQVVAGVLAEDAARVNESFNHWIVTQTPLVTVKAAMTLDGKIATRTGESKWITGPEARALTMHVRRGVDAIAVGINTVLADDPSLTVRTSEGIDAARQPRRIVFDSEGRIPLDRKLVTDKHAARTVVVVTRRAPEKRVAALARRVTVLIAPERAIGIDLKWVLKKLGRENVTSLLVEGGGELNASFLFGGHAHRVLFFYAPKVVGGRDARKVVAGDGIARLEDAIRLQNVDWGMAGPDIVLRAEVAKPLATRRRR